jgi:hypothetical protein
VIPGARREQPGHGVGAHEIHQVGEAAYRRRLGARHAARTEVVQLEWQLAFGIVAGAFQEAANGLLRMPAGRRHRHRIPEPQQQRLE